MLKAKTNPIIEELINKLFKKSNILKISSNDKINYPEDSPKTGIA